MKLSVLSKKWIPDEVFSKYLKIEVGQVSVTTNQSDLSQGTLKFKRTWTHSKDLIVETSKQVSDIHFERHLAMIEAVK